MLIIQSASIKPIKYSVCLPKVYFPKNLWPKGKLVEEFYEVLAVSATSRIEAAKIAWEENKNRWLPLMNPKQTSVRRISLFVNDPKAVGTGGGNPGRILPIEVYKD
jgi:hypothetical protein